MASGVLPNLHVGTGGSEAAHTAHAGHSAAHAAATAAGGRRGFFGALGHEGFGGEDQAGDGGRVLQGGTGHFGRVHDALGDQVAELAGRGVVALAGLLDLLDDDRAFDTGVVRDLAGRLFEGAADDGDADFLIAFQLKSYPGRR